MSQRCEVERRETKSILIAWFTMEVYDMIDKHGVEDHSPHHHHHRSLVPSIHPSLHSKHIRTQEIKKDFIAGLILILIVVIACSSKILSSTSAARIILSLILTLPLLLPLTLTLTPYPYPSSLATVLHQLINAPLVLHAPHPTSPLHF
ncbi:hypothetical protein EDD21DRAFT_100270 [Dissophora ornata]|nr:hypothetical protein EDD21DRAFT_100270 [Dissophora ornata]